MPDAPMFDTLITLAALGTSGVCILAIFWAGWTIQKTVRSGVANAYFNAKTIDECRAENDRRTAELAAEQDTRQQMIGDLTPLLIIGWRERCGSRSGRRRAST